MKKYLFSQFRSGEFEVIYQQLTTVFDIPIDELRALYQVMREEFEIEGYPEHTISRTVFHSWDQNFQARYEQAFVVGIDFPSILECANGVVEKKTIAILGQDPLRRSDKPIPDISTGTPYALHLKNCRQVLRNTRLYFDLIQVLLEAGYRVYLTDVLKIWVSEANRCQGISLSPKDRDRFIQVLKAELEIVAPEAVITWGRTASNTIKGLGLATKHFEFPHPSGAANGAWRKLLGKPATRDNRIQFWKQTLLDYLEAP